MENEKVLDDISFNLNSDDFLCVLGESGSGKTTLLKLIAGLLIPDEGNIIINEDNQNFVPAHKRKIGYVFQEPKLYTHLTVYENLMLGIKHIKLTFEEKDLLIKKLMKAFHLLSFMNIKPRYLSYGEQEKVALAKVFLVQEDLYLFDEAMSGLDTLSKKRTLNYINKIKKENHAPMIYVSHDEENIPSFTTKVLIFKNGKIEKPIFYFFDFNFFCIRHNTTKSIYIRTFYFVCICITLNCHTIYLTFHLYIK